MLFRRVSGISFSSLSSSSSRPSSARDRAASWSSAALTLDRRQRFHSRARDVSTRRRERARRPFRKRGGGSGLRRNGRRWDGEGARPFSPKTVAYGFRVNTTVARPRVPAAKFSRNACAVSCASDEKINKQKKNKKPVSCTPCVCVCSAVYTTIRFCG